MSIKDPAKQLEITFKTIFIDRMQDMPIINHNIEVKAVGFTPWQQYHFGALITPWFMNLILIPQQENQLNGNVGKIKKIQLPSGYYDFILNFEQGIGYYLSCSLFSPMFIFENQSAAELTAIESLIAILDAKDLDGSTKTPATTQNDNTEASKSISTINASRRNFIRGKILPKASKR